MTLIAVSKTKPVEAIKECVKAGHLTFGENYVCRWTDVVKMVMFVCFTMQVQELEEKGPQVYTNMMRILCFC